MQDTFNLTFGEAYHFFNFEQAFKKPWIFASFKLHALLRNKGETLSFTEKIKSLQTISMKRALKLNKYAKEKAEIKVEIDRS